VPSVVKLPSRVKITFSPLPKTTAAHKVCKLALVCVQLSVICILMHFYLHKPEQKFILRMDEEELVQAVV